MNILLSSLPCAVRCGGKNYRIKPDFRTWITVSEILQKTGSFIAAAGVCFIDLPPDADSVCESILFFLTRGEKADGGGEALYSFTEDADYIYSAFLTQYGIDLCTEDLHWWKFISLFRGLGDEHKISKLMSIRSCNPADISDKKTREKMARLKRKCALKHRQDIAEAFE